MSNILTLIAEQIVNYLLAASMTAAVLTTLAWVIIKAAKIRAPIYRHMLWLYLLIGVVILPAIWVYGPKLTVAVLPAQAEPAKAVTLPTDADHTVELAQNMSPETHSPKLTSAETPVVVQASSPHPFPLKTVLAGLWLIGIVLMFTRLAVGWYRLRRICLAAEPLLQNNRFANTDERNLRILLTSQIDGPVCFGLLQPVIILPRKMYENSTAEDLQMVLSHELAHIERRDCLTNLLQRVIEAVFFFHPLIWYASFQLTQQREQICDNFVLARGASATNYVGLLSRIVEQGFEKNRLQAVALFEGRLLSRVRLLLDPKHNNQIKASRWAKIVCGIVVLICLTFGTLRLEAKSEVDVPQAVPAQTEQLQSADPNDTEAIDPNAVKQDFRTIARKLLLYKQQSGYYPETLEQLDAAVPKDLYSPTGQSYHYESNRKRFILSSCGRDGIYGNDDDEIYFVNVGDRQKLFGQRHEVYPLQDEEEATQSEMVPGERPQGNCLISGKVVSAKTGEPVDHARLYLHYSGTHGSIFIDVASDGTFEFKDIPVGPHSLTTIHVAGYQDTAYDPENKGGQYPRFSLQDGEKRAGLVFEVEPAFRISGTVSDENGNLPADIDTLRILAWIEKDDGQGYKSKQTRVNRADGSYFIDGLRGEPVYIMAINWRAAKQGDSYPPIYYPGTFSRNDAEQITFDDQWDVKNIDIQLQKTGGVVLEGTVTDQTGQPVPEAFVVAHHRDMLFDFATAYTDQQGHYQIQGLADGKFLVHVDAVHRGLVRTRMPVDIDDTNGKVKLDFTLRQGVTISGKFVDETGNDWQIGQSYGHANIKNYPDPNSDSETGTKTRMSFSLTDFRNKYRPKDIRDGSAGSFSSGQGDYNGESMLFPTESTFIIEAIMPGLTTITFSPKKEGQETLEILYNGRNIMETGIETKPGEEIKDVTIVIRTT